jgi:hypothetical protein
MTSSRGETSQTARARVSQRGAGDPAGVFCSNGFANQICKNAFPHLVPSVQWVKILFFCEDFPGIALRP